MQQSCVYILASKQVGTLYVGVTSDLVSRVWQHKNDVAEGFTKKYRVHGLSAFPRFSNRRISNTESFPLRYSGLQQIRNEHKKTGGPQ
jgi:putative endonuclease